MSALASPSKLSTADVSTTLRGLAPREATYATAFVDALLTAACARAASDVHLTPSAEGLDIRWRVDGVLEKLGGFPLGEATDVVARLKVMADLLTYRQETPQEGRLRFDNARVEMRLSTFPTLHGERAVVRLFPKASELTRVAELKLSSDLETQLLRSLHETSGAIIVTGPAGSGKTTTVYAALREIMAQSALRSVVTLEDPIEAELSGAAQAAIQPAAGFDFAMALRSLMRQDPEVIMVGEVRDRETAMAAFQAALTGHLVLTTFHAGSACSAISRLQDMGIEPYLLRSGVQALLGQRLVRHLCECAVESSDPLNRLGLPVESCRLPHGCPACAQSGYRGRMVLAEMLPTLIGPLGAAVLAHADARDLQCLAVKAGMQTLLDRACHAVALGLTSPHEVRRVLGFATATETTSV